MEEFTDVELVDSEEPFVGQAPHMTPDLQTFEEAIKRDPIALGRAVVRSIRASGQRRDHFHSVVVAGNANKHFSLGTRVDIIVPELQLLRDVKTRWDSIYHMIQRLRVMRLVCFSRWILSFAHACLLRR